jgi:hypothetical protein
VRASVNLKEHGKITRFIVLAVQDTTYLNWAHHPATQGLGGISDAGRGVICHSTLTVTPERLPLGLLAQKELGARRHDVRLVGIE